MTDSKEKPEGEEYSEDELVEMALKNFNSFVEEQTTHYAFIPDDPDGSSIDEAHGDPDVGSSEQCETGVSEVREEIIPSDGNPPNQGGDA